MGARRSWVVQEAAERAALEGRAVRELRDVAVQLVTLHDRERDPKRKEAYKQAAQLVIDRIAALRGPAQD